MQVRLTIQEKLKDLRVERHLTLVELAEQTGISSSALGKYEADDYKDISPFSIVTLAKFYGVSTDYLLGLTEQKNHPDTALEELHLSDAMIELLKSGKINNRLLCEMATHEGFRKLMTDLEIYVDRIASMQLSNLNAIVDMARVEIEKKYNPDAEDQYIQTLKAAHIDEDNYFALMVHDDMDVIAKDIRSAHTDLHDLYKDLACLRGRFFYFSEFYNTGSGHNLLQHKTTSKRIKFHMNYSITHVGLQANSIKSLPLVAALCAMLHYFGCTYFYKAPA